jgi:hypothetical protein
MESFGRMELIRDHLGERKNDSSEGGVIPKP